MGNVRNFSFNFQTLHLICAIHHLAGPIHNVTTETVHVCRSITATPTWVAAQSVLSALIVKEIRYVYVRSV